MSGRPGAWSVSLGAMLDLLMLVMVLLGCGLGLFLLLVEADAAWKVASLPGIEGAGAPWWLELLLGLGVLVLPLVWISRQPDPAGSGARDA